MTYVRTIIRELSLSLEKYQLAFCTYGRTSAIYTRKWFPLQGELASLTKKMLYSLINNKPILIHSKLAASIVQDTLAREAVENEGGEEETTGGYFYCYFYRSAQARKSFRFLALEFNSQKTNAPASQYGGRVWVPVTKRAHGY